MVAVSAGEQRIPGLHIEGERKNCQVAAIGGRPKAVEILDQSGGGLGLGGGPVESQQAGKKERDLAVLRFVRCTRTRTAFGSRPAGTGTSVSFGFEGLAM